MNENLNELETKPTQPEESLPEAAPVQQKDETPAEKSFKELREKYKKEAEERERLEKLLSEREALHQAPPQQRPNIDAMADDDLLEVGQIRGELNVLRNEAALNVMYRRFKDFDQVVTAENIAALEKAKPALAQMINNYPNRLQQYEEVYDAIKNYGIYKKPEEIAEDQRIEANKSKPKPSNAVMQSRSPLADASSWGNHAPTSEQKFDHWKWAQAQMKQLNRKPS